MTFTCIADTHRKHSQLDLAGDTDVLIHAGDIGAHNKENLINFLGWFQKQDYKHKIFIAGNHDGFIENFPGQAKYVIDKYDVHYLQDNYVTIDGIKIWGSPWSREFGGWAFMRTDVEMHDHLKTVPDVDIMVSHGPAYNILDRTRNGERVGFIGFDHIKFDKFICGHIHESYGEREIGNQHYINCSVVNVNLDVTNKPITFKYINNG